MTIKWNKTSQEREDGIRNITAVTPFGEVDIYACPQFNEMLLPKVNRGEMRIDDAIIRWDWVVNLFENEFWVTSRADARRLVKCMVVVHNNQPLSIEDEIFANNVARTEDEIFANNVARNFSADFMRQIQNKQRLDWFEEQQQKRDEAGNYDTCCDGCGADFDANEICVCDYI
jgi:hypothetical protein